MPLNYKLRELVVLSLINVSRAGLETALPLVSAVNAYNVPHVVRALLWHVRAAGPLPATGDALGELQRCILAALATADNVWRFAAAAAAVFADAGFASLGHRPVLAKYLRGGGL